MIWWDFTNGLFILFFVMAVFLFLIFCFFAISFFVSARRTRQYRELIYAQKNSKRIYVLNVKKGTTTYFNTSDLTKKVTIDLETFYAHFYAHDADVVKQWIYDICTSVSDVTQYLEVDIHTKFHNKNFFTLLKLEKFNPEQGLIFIESNILKYVYPQNNPYKKVRGKINGVLKRSQMSELINKTNSAGGYTFAIRFYYMHQAALQSEEIERYLLMSLKNEVYPFLHNPKSPRQIVNPNSNEIFLFDLKMSNKDIALALANSIANNLNRTLALSGYKEAVNFAIGIIENRLFYRSFDTIIEQAKNACMIAQHENKQVMFGKYSRTGNIDVNKFEDDIKHLLKDDAIRYLFRPILVANKKRDYLFGYMNYIRAYDSPFTTIQEMSKYAFRVNKGKELFANFAKNVIPRFASQTSGKKDLKLFYSVSLYDIEYIISVLPQINKYKDVNLVLVFQEQEIQDNISNISALHQSFDELKKQNFKLAISLEDQDLLLESQLYEYFDYYIAGASMLGEIKHNNRIRLSIHTLIEQLLRYNKTIIATDLEGWQSVELIIKAGINYLSCETITPSNDMLLPIDKKKMQKVNNFADKYL